MFGIKDTIKESINKKKHHNKTEGIETLLKEYLKSDEKVIVAQNTKYKDGEVRQPKPCIFILTDKRFFFIPKKGNRPDTIDTWQIIERNKLLSMDYIKSPKGHLEVEFYNINTDKLKKIHIFNIGLEETNRLLRDLKEFNF